MNFKIYDLYSDLKPNGKEEHLVNHLNKLDVFDAGHNLRYLINNDVFYERGVLMGSLGQEYVASSNTIKNKQWVPIDGIEPFERTIFALDFSSNTLLIQNRNYSQKNLNTGIAYSRINTILTEACKTIFKTDFIPIVVNIPAGNEVFLKFFEHSRVLELKVSNLNTRHVLQGEKISKDKQFNSDLLNYWNTEDKNTNFLHIKASDDGELNNNPFALLASNSPNAKIDRISYYNENEGKSILVERNKFDKFEVPKVTKDEESITVYEATIDEINNRRGFLRAVKQVIKE
ncbi:hypothetical protein [Listeria newyorkensis]|uniref:hypothetical protein n=1 Tax=Listeria newyorkensis TaxID=1497681 RepID=UPI0010F4EEAD|nr:hypothetical protein [Listeria newyorkensis]